MFKWATRECLNGEAGGVCACVFVEGVGIRQQECVVMQGGFFSMMWQVCMFCFLFCFDALFFPYVQPLSVDLKFCCTAGDILALW